MTAKLLSRTHEPLTRPSATLSPLRGARGTRYSHRECPSPRLWGEGAAKRRMRGSRCANLDITHHSSLITHHSSLSRHSQINQLDPHLRGGFARALVAVKLAVINFADAGVGDELETVPARR